MRTLSDRTYIFDRNLANRVASVTISTLIIAIFTQIRVHIPFTPVPITGQTFAVLMMAYVLGSKLGFMSVCFYILAGILGLPFFASGGSGFLYLKGVTGGYLLGFLISAFVVGYCSERGLFKSFFGSIILFSIGLIPTFALGLLWLGYLLGYEGVFHLGLTPFIPGELLKVILASGIVSLKLSILQRSYEG